MHSRKRRTVVQTILSDFHGKRTILFVSKEKFLWKTMKYSSRPHTLASSGRIPNNTVNRLILSDLYLNSKVFTNSIHSLCKITCHLHMNQDPVDIGMSLIPRPS